MSLYGSGFGVRKSEEEEVTGEYREIKVEGGIRFVGVSCGSNFSGAVSEDGEIFTFGENEYGQLGRKGRKGSREKVPGRVGCLSTVRISGVSCGEKHCIVWTSMGDSMSWGCNKRGQLGVGDLFDRSSPSLVHGPWMSTGVCISACFSGKEHSLFLSSRFQLYSCGRGTEGQLGLGDCEDKKWVHPIQSLFGSPVIQCSAGSSHSACVTLGGLLYLWGSNDFGQLGISDPGIKKSPFLLESIHNNNLRAEQVSCGTSHTLLITDKFCMSWGKNHHRQLGRDTSSVFGSQLPATITELLGGAKVTKTACGERHSLALRQDGSTLSWGSNISRALGHLLSYQFVPLPTRIPSLKGLHVTDISAGHSHSLVVVGDGNQEDDWAPPFLRTDIEHVRLCFQSPNFSGLIRLLADVFSHPTCLNASFLTSSPKGSCLTLDLAGVREAYLLILQSGSTHVLDSLYNSTSHAISCLHEIQLNEETMRVFSIILESPVFLSGDQGKIFPLFEKICASLMRVRSHKSAQEILHSNWRNLSSEYFMRLVNIFMRFLTFLVDAQMFDSNLVAVCSLLEDLYQVNKEAGQVVPYDQFHNKSVSSFYSNLKAFDAIKADFERWRSSENVFTFVRYPFLLDAAAKAGLFLADAHFEMEKGMEQALWTFYALRDGGQIPANLGGIIPFFRIKVARESIVQDLLLELENTPPPVLKLPIMVSFRGEEGVDEGGLTKEFFQLVVRELFHPKYDMWVYNEESRTFWINGNSVESAEEYRIVGMILGLALYNSIIIDARFPRVFFKKILGLPFDQSDLLDAMPEVGTSLMKFLQYSGNVEDMGVYFSVTEQVFGAAITNELIPDGSDIPVTNENREKYVHLYLRYVFQEHVETQWNAFQEGFLLVAGVDVLHMCHPEELEKLICGSSDNPDFTELEAIAKYEGYSANSLVVKWFWGFAHSLCVSDKRKMLAFCTGSGRIPIKGLGSISFLIQRSGPDTDLLPTASTCYNILLLPDYSSESKLCSKVLSAIQESEGFGLQ